MTQEELRQAEEEEAEAPHDEWDERSAHREAQELEQEAHDENKLRVRRPRVSQNQKNPGCLKVCLIIG